MKDEMRTLVTKAALDVQHRCAGCGVLLTAYGREESKAWSCTICVVPGTTVATRYEPEKAD